MLWQLKLNRFRRVEKLVIISDIVAALKSRAEKRYVLNAKAKQIAENETPYQYVDSKSLWTYESNGGVETIITKGPINSDIFVMVSNKSTQ